MDEKVNMSQGIDLRRKKALYRATHRGTKEMDWLLGRYADAKLGEMNRDELTEFERFLAISDPELNEWLFDPSVCANSEFRELIDRIRRHHQMDA